MNFYYSKTTNGFYDIRLKSSYADNWPSDAIQITNDLYADLIAGQSSGMIITPNSEGFPSLCEPAPLTDEELRQKIYYEKNSLIDIALRQINMIETSIKYADYKPEDNDAPEKRNLTAWVNYFNELKSIEQQPNYPFEVEWPEIPSDIVTT